MLLHRLLQSKSFHFPKYVRRASILSGLKNNPVIVSANKDVHTNLALEHWLFTNLTFRKPGKNDAETTEEFLNPIVLIWVDEPSIVIGRHQNPWTESTVGFLNKTGIKLARRHSGGGCVYHDENNINISIIGPREYFDKRQENLRFLAKILADSYSVKCEPNKRHDLIHSDSGLKLSGSAARLGRFNCFHHFTLLIDTDKDILHTAIRPKQQDFISSNSSPSTRAGVINLKEFYLKAEVNQVINDLALAYSKLYGSSKKAEKVEKVTGDQSEFKNIDEIRSNLTSWEWVYGMTPKFKLEKVVNLIVRGEEVPIKFLIHINKGLFESIDIQGNLIDQGIVDKFSSLNGTRFTYQDAMVNVAQFLKVDENNSSQASGHTFGLDKLFATYLLQMIHECNYLTDKS